MISWQLVGALVALAVAGFDPFGALALLAVIAGGASRRAVAAFTAAASAVILGCAVVVDALARTLLPEGLPHVPRIVWGVVEGIAAVGLVAWGLVRLRGRSSRREGTLSGRRAVGLGLAGAAYGLTVLLDPAFWGLVALVHRLGEGSAVGMAVVWWVIAQSPLIVLTLAVVVGAGERAAGRLRRLWRRWGPVLGAVTTVLVLVCGAALAVDVVVWATTGSFVVG
ncbi:hypothetical protein ACSDQ9_08625 [Aestuariimicrobium soli]|uniref:hypothetical protein n=1 Tax=Aestuariimicrobium soli TaxID=2035834 RepID=UPI003EBC406A